MINHPFWEHHDHELTLIFMFKQFAMLLQLVFDSEVMCCRIRPGSSVWWHALSLPIPLGMAAFAHWVSLLNWITPKSKKNRYWMYWYALTLHTYMILHDLIFFGEYRSFGKLNFTDLWPSLKTETHRSRWAEKVAFVHR